MAREPLRIERSRISGFKSIREADLTLGPLNVMIGANGAGKSNLVSYFALLKAALDARLDGHVGRYGGPNAFLHLGSKTQNSWAWWVSSNSASPTLQQTFLDTLLLRERLKTALHP